MCNVWVNVFMCDVCEEWSNCGVYWTVGDDEDGRHVGCHSMDACDVSKNISLLLIHNLV